MRRLVALTGMLMMLVASAYARAELNIQITRSSDQAIPIAIAPFTANGQQLPQDVSQIIENDLRNSGQFSPLPRDRQVGNPAPGDQIDYQAWQASRANYLVVGRVEPNGNGYRITYELHDIFGNARELGEVVTSGPDQLRSRAHYVADQIFEKITGIRGAFQTRIAYITSQGIDPNISFALYVADQDGYNPQQVLTSNQPVLSPTWSPDGGKLAYVSFESGRPAIYVQDLATGRRLQLTSFTGINGAPAWSPDGRKMAMSLSKDGTPDIYVMDLATRNLERLTNNSAINTEPDYSPDGSSLIFTSDRSGQPQLYRYDFAAGQAQRLTFTGNYNAGGHYSPDGETVFMVTRTDRGYQVAKQDLATNRVTVLTDTGWDEAPAIAPNGTMVVYATQQGTRGVLGAVSADGRASFVIPSPEGNVREPAWSPFLN